MPRIRVELRNEFGLGDPQLHRAASKDDPKAILDGVAVAGLVGILRQLGDLAEFAAEVFRGLHEQVMATSVRSQRMLTQVQRIETELPTLEKSILSQTSHIHYAYTAGSEWHPDIQPEQNHLAQSDLPQFIMDSYEESRDPPHLFLLDKFDPAGTGACLRRYSDPSFFKTAWANSAEGNVEKLRHKRANKTKKRGSRQLGDTQLATSISQCYSRLQIASPDTDEQSFAAETVSTSNSRSLSKQTNRSLSSDSERGSNTGERILVVNSSLGSQEFEHANSPAYRLRTWYNDTPTHSPRDERNGEVVAADSPPQLMQSHVADRPSSVTWDEKTEIVKPIPPVESMSQSQNHASDTVPASSERSNLEVASASQPHVDQDHVVSDAENIAKLISSQKQIEEVTSETDNYLDALNTIESETDTDYECQTKRELKLQSEVKNTVAESQTDETYQVSAHNSDSSEVECPIDPYNFSNKETTPAPPCPILSESSIHAQPSELSSLDSTIDFSVKADLFEHSSRLNGFDSINNTMQAGSRIPNSNENEITENSCIPPKPPKTSEKPSVTVWTNGGLLGLEPSKPPDFAVPNASNQSPIPAANNGNCSFSHEIVMPELHHVVENSTLLTKSAEEMEPNTTARAMTSPAKIAPSDCHNLPLDQLAKKSSIAFHNEYSVSGQHKQDENLITTQKYPEIITVLLDTQQEKVKDPLHGGIFSQGHGLEPLVDSKNTVQCTESSQNNIEVPLGLAGIAQRFLLNGLGRKASLVKGVGRSSDLSTTESLKTKEWSPEIEQKAWLNGMATLASHGSSPRKQPQVGFFDDPSSSPPLEHMKISFQPVHRLETSKLKLEFPNGHHHFHESMQDIVFPSIQLLPDFPGEAQDTGSESDDDTFYRSSPSPSEDLLSLCSESNSEQWESAELTGNKDEDFYDALRQVPSSISISSSFELEESNHHGTSPTCQIESSNPENSEQPLEPYSMFDSPSIDVVNSLSNKQKGEHDSKQNCPLYSALQCPNELPPPPPLPPLEWRMMRPSCRWEEKQESISEGTSRLNNLQVDMIDTIKGKLGHNMPHINAIDYRQNDQQVHPSLASLQPKPAAEQNNSHIEKHSASPHKLPNLNGSIEANQSSSGKDLDERQDLLHQIRTKSFNLRPTAHPTKSSSPSSDPSTNVKVAAILEKASAIRQACIGGDDENWSDG